MRSLKEKWEGNGKGIHEGLERVMGAWREQGIFLWIQIWQFFLGIASELKKMSAKFFDESSGVEVSQKLVFLDGQFKMSWNRVYFFWRGKIVTSNRRDLTCPPQGVVCVVLFYQTNIRELLTVTTEIRREQKLPAHDGSVLSVTELFPGTNRTHIRVM